MGNNYMFDFAEFRKLVEREQGEVARVANSTLMLKYIERVSASCA